MGLFFYTKKGSIISTVDLPTTEIIEPNKFGKKEVLWGFFLCFFKRMIFPDLQKSNITKMKYYN